MENKQPLRDIKATDFFPYFGYKDYSRRNEYTVHKEEVMKKKDILGAYNVILLIPVIAAGTFFVVKGLERLF